VLSLSLVNLNETGLDISGSQQQAVTLKILLDCMAVAAISSGSELLSQDVYRRRVFQLSPVTGEEIHTISAASLSLLSDVGTLSSCGQSM
jgi:hypothetical protein